MSQSFCIDYQDIVDAGKRLEKTALMTPLLEQPLFNAKDFQNASSGRILVKAESLQKTGAFKLRGAVNAISQLSEAEKARGIVTFSSGNHAQATAYAAQLFSLSATIVMPADAPLFKREATAAYGANVILYDRFTESREGIARDIAEKTGAVLIPPFNHPHIIAGQGTVGLEIALQCKDLGIVPEQLVVGCSGGGLAAGIAVAMKHHFPDIELYAAEPENFDDLAQSFKAGHKISVSSKQASICDALMAETTGELTYPILSHYYADSLTVNDSDVMKAVTEYARYFKLVVEPGGAAALATLVSGKLNITDKITIVVASGGNTDLFTPNQIPS